MFRISERFKEVDMQNLLAQLVQLENVINQLANIRSQLLVAHSNALLCLESLRWLKENKAPPSMLLPLGSGVFIKVGQPDLSLLMVSIGSGILVKKPIDEAISIMEERIKKLEQSIKDVEINLSKAINSYENVRNMIVMLQSKTQSKERGISES